MNDKILVEPAFIHFFLNENLYLIEKKMNVEEQVVIDHPRKKKSFSKSFLIFLNKQVYEETSILKIFLEKILKAVDVGILEVEILDSNEVDFETMEENNINHCLIFDEKDRVATEKYKIEKLKKLTFMVIDDLEKINSDVVLKKQLWAALKQMFGR